MESCHLAAARHMKLWSLNAKLSFQEPQQLTTFTWWVHLNRVWQRTFHFKDVIAIFLGLQTLWPYSLKKPDFFRFRVFFRASSLQNEVGDPPIFFTFLTSLTHHLSRKNSMLENFRANVLNNGSNRIPWDGKNWDFENSVSPPMKKKPFLKILTCLRVLTLASILCSMLVDRFLGLTSELIKKLWIGSLHLFTKLLGPWQINQEVPNYNLNNL